MDSSMIIIIILVIIVVCGATWMLCKKSSSSEGIVAVSNIGHKEGGSPSKGSDSARKCNDMTESSIHLVNQECFHPNDVEVEPWMFGQLCDTGRLESKVDSHGYMFHGIIINPNRGEQPQPGTTQNQHNETLESEVAAEPGVRIH